MNHKRLILGLGSVVAVLAIGGLAIVNTATLSGRSEMVYETDGPSFSSVADLTKASQDVVHVKVLSAGAAYQIPFDAPVTNVAARPSGGAKGANTDLSKVPAIAAPKGILKTDFTVEVLDNVRGAKLHKGQQLVVSQIGGKSADGMLSASADHDPLMQVGGEEILFLNQDAASGKFFTTGGGAGRFVVQSNGAVTAVDHESAISRIHTGKPASFLKSEVQSVQ